MDASRLKFCRDIATSFSQLHPNFLISRQGRRCLCGAMFSVHYHARKHGTVYLNQTFDALARWTVSSKSESRYTEELQHTP